MERMQYLEKKCFEKDKMLIFWPSFTCIGDGFGRFWWILAYQRQVLDIQQSGFAGRNISCVDVTWMKRSSSGGSFFSIIGLPDLGRSPANLFARTNWLFGGSFMNIKMRSYIINVDSSFYHARHSAGHIQISSNNCYLLVCSSRWPSEHIFLSDYFP